MLDADIEPEDQEIEHYYTQHHDHDRNGKITHHPQEGLYQNTLILHFQKHFQTSEFEVPFTDGQTEIVYKN